jgi:hypothetical protein
VVRWVCAVLPLLLLAGCAGGSEERSATACLNAMTAAAAGPDST